MTPDVAICQTQTAKIRYISSFTADKWAKKPQGRTPPRSGTMGCCLRKKIWLKCFKPPAKCLKNQARSDGPSGENPLNQTSFAKRNWRLIELKKFTMRFREPRHWATWKQQCRKVLVRIDEHQIALDAIRNYLNHQAEYSLCCKISDSAFRYYCKTKMNGIARRHTKPANLFVSVPGKGRGQLDLYLNIRAESRNLAKRSPIHRLDEAHLRIKFLVAKTHECPNAMNAYFRERESSKRITAL